MKYPSEKEAIELLNKYKVPEEVIEHCKKVRNKALKIADQISAKGHKVDKELVKSIALLHDIGKYKYSRERGCSESELGLHAPESQLLLEKLGYPELAKICGAHFLFSVTKNEAKKLGWPIPVHLPNILEGKIIFIADKIRGDRAPEEEIRRMIERSDLYVKYWNKCPGLKEKTLRKALEIIKELRNLGWNGKVK